MWNCVEYKTEIIHHILKMQYISLLRECIKLILMGFLFEFTALLKTKEREFDRMTTDQTIT